jgi:hypothetical protein
LRLRDLRFSIPDWNVTRRFLLLSGRADGRDELTVTCGSGKVTRHAGLRPFVITRPGEVDDPRQAL